MRRCFYSILNLLLIILLNGYTNVAAHTTQLTMENLDLTLKSAQVSEKKFIWDLCSL
jgi:hypothetical protein